MSLRGEPPSGDMRDAVQEFAAPGRSVQKLGDSRLTATLLAENVAYVAAVELLKLLRPGIELQRSVYLDRTASEEELLDTLDTWLRGAPQCVSQSARSMFLTRKLLEEVMSRTRDRLHPEMYRFLDEGLIEASRQRARAAEGWLRRSRYSHLLNVRDGPEANDLVRCFEQAMPPRWVKYWFFSHVETPAPGWVLAQSPDQDFNMTTPILHSLAAAHRAGNTDAQQMYAQLLAGLAKHADIAFYQGIAAFNAFSEGWATEPDGNSSPICAGAEWFEPDGLSTEDVAGIKAFRDCLRTFGGASVRLPDGMSAVAAILQAGLFTIRSAFGPFDALASRVAAMEPDERRALVAVRYGSLRDWTEAGGGRFRTDPEYVKRMSPITDEIDRTPQ